MWFKRGKSECAWFFVVVVTLSAARAAIGQTDPPVQDSKAWESRFEAACEGKKYDQAIAIATKLAKTDPKGYLWQFNLARAYSLKGDRENALKWFRTCAENGFRDIKKAKEHPDLANIGSERGYLDALDVIRKNRLAAWENYKQKAAEKKPQVVFPPKYVADDPAPLLIALHDRGSNARKCAKQWQESAGVIGCILVVPEGFYPVKEGGYDWGNAHEGDYMVTQALEYATEEYNIAPRRTMVAGFGRGGLVALVAGYRHPYEFRGVIAVGASYNPDDARPPNPLRSFVPKYYLMVGAEDKALEDNRKIKEDYRAMGLDVELQVYDGVGHGFPADRDAALLKALRHIQHPYE